MICSELYAIIPIAHRNPRGERIAEQSANHDGEGTQQGRLIPMPVYPFPTQRTVEQIAQEKEKRDQRGQRILQFFCMRKKGYFQRPLELPIDRGQESYDEVDESQDRERSQTIWLLRIHETKVF